MKIRYNSIEISNNIYALTEQNSCHLRSLKLYVPFAALQGHLLGKTCADYAGERTSDTVPEILTPSRPEEIRLMGRKV